MLQYEQNERGQESVEWWFIVTVISFVVMFALINWGTLINTTIMSINSTLNSINTNITTGT